MLRYWRLISVVLLVFSSVMLDQISKIDAEKHLMTYEDEENLKFYEGRRVLLWKIGEPPASLTERPSYFSINLNYIRNQGAAWGFLSDLRDSIRIPFFYVMTTIAIIFILNYIRTTPISYRLPRFALYLILSGALGNLVDRIRHGYVIDWIDVEWTIFGWFYNFPSFNWADSCITVGVSMLIVEIIFFEKKRKNLNSDQAS